MTHPMCPICGETYLLAYYWQELGQCIETSTGDWDALASDAYALLDTKPIHALRCLSCDRGIELTKEVMEWFDKNA